MQDTSGWATQSTGDLDVMRHLADEFQPTNIASDLTTEKTQQTPTTDYQGLSIIYILIVQSKHAAPLPPALTLLSPSHKAAA